MMGGKALGFDSARLNADDYFTLVRNVEHAFSAAQYGSHNRASIRSIRAYKNKKDFGDADFLFTGTPLEWQRFGETYGDILPGATAHNNRNGNVFSVGIDVSDGAGAIFQVDFIYAGETQKTADIMATYFAYNDLGNLMGRVAHRMGLKWGQDGLVYVMRDPETHDHVIGEYNFTEATDLETSFKIMGYDHANWRRGFAELTDVFEYVTTSPYFSPDIYLLHNRNSISRARDAKRETYKKFLVWVGEKENVRNFHIPEDSRPRFKEWILHGLCVDYPEFAAWYHTQGKRYNVKRLATAYFNGDLIAEFSGLQGKELGALMTKVKGNLARRRVLASMTGYGGVPEDLNQWIVENPLEVTEAYKEEIKKL